MSDLRLRPDVSVSPITSAAAPLMLQWMGDPQVAANIGLTRTPSLEKTRQWIDRALHEDAAWPFGIQWNGEHVGNVVFDQIDPHLSAARFSVYIGVPAARGCGVGTTGMYRAIQEVFRTRGLHKIWLTVHAENLGAIRSYQRLGFQLEGILRDGFLLNGRRLPALYMGLLREDHERVGTC